MANWWPFGRKGDNTVHLNLLSGFWKPRGDISLESSEGIFSAVTRLSNVLGSTPFHLYQGPKIASNHWIERLMNYEAAPGVTPFLYKSTLETCRNVYGNGYALKVPESYGQTERLDILDPTKVEPMREQRSGEIWYRVSAPDGKTFYIHYREMIHVKHVSTGGVKGVNPLEVLADALKYDDQMHEFSLRQIKGINSCTTLEFPTNMGKEQKDEAVKSFRDNYESSSGGVVVLTGGVKANVITRSPVDSKVMDMERVTKGRIAAVYSMPPHMLGSFDKSNYATNEQQMLEFLQLTMQATFTQYEEEHKLKLLTYKDVKAGYKFRFDKDQMIIPTRLQRAQEAQYEVRSAVRMPNEIREERGWEPAEGGNQLMGSRDLAPLKWLMENPDKVRQNKGGAT